MAMNKNKSGSLSKLAGHFIISRTAVYNWVNKYKDELLKSGIIEERKRGAKKYLYIKDVDEFILFFQERDVFLTEE